MHVACPHRASPDVGVITHAPGRAPERTKMVAVFGITAICSPLGEADETTRSCVSVCGMGLTGQDEKDVPGEAR